MTVEIIDYPPCQFTPDGIHDVKVSVHVNARYSRYCGACGLIFKAKMKTPKQRRAIKVGTETLRWGMSTRRMGILCRLSSRDGWQCRYCGIKLTWNVATIDHRVPASKGGSNEDENLCLACEACNQEKADKDVGEFLSSKWLSHRRDHIAKLSPVRN